MEFKANELAIKDIASIKNTIITATAENRRDILKAFDDMELQTELKARGAFCSANAEVIARHRAEIISRRYYELKGKSKAERGFYERDKAKI